MESVRKNGATGIWIFAGLMLISIIGGLGVGTFTSITNNRNNQAQMSSGTKLPTLSNVGGDAGVAMRVNGEAVSVEDFQDNLDFMSRQYLQDRSDYDMLLQIYGETARKLVRDEVLLQKGRELNVTVTPEELETERNKIIDQFLAADSGSTGNVVGDLAKNLSKTKQRREAFKTYLRSNGLSNAEWEKQVRRGLLVTNSQKKLGEAADAEKEKKMYETRDIIDERLAAGELFSELAKEFSEDSNAANGGDLNTWVFPGLVQDPENDKVLFETPVGETTPWFDIPAGSQRFQVYEKREAEGPEFEAEKPDLIKKIRDEKGDDYEPTDEEIADRYRAVKARQIQLNNTDPMASYQQIGDLVSAAKVEINLPYVLAYQALYDDRLYTPDSISFDDLVAVARTAAVGENYDFELMRAKWDNRMPKPKEDEAAADTTDDAASADEAATTDAAAGEEVADEAAAEDAPAADEAAATDEADATETEPVASIEDALVEDVAAEAATPDATTPLYALAIGYLKMGQAGEGESPSMFSYDLVASTYIQWMDKEETLTGQQLDRSAARQQVEEALAQVVKSDNYNASAYAMRGLNLAWLDRGSEAKEQLDFALKYVSSKDTATLDEIRKAYEKLDDQDGLAKVDELENQARQAQLQEMLQNAKDNPDSSIPFNGGEIKLPDIGDLETGAGSDSAAGGGADTGDADNGGADGGAEGSSEGGETPPADTPPADNPGNE